MRAWKEAPPSEAGGPAAEPAPPGLRPPSVALPAATGRYVIRGEIAHGGMGAVLLGLDTAMGRDLAIKVLRDGLEGRPEYVRRFFQEARIHGRLQHPGVVPIYEMGEFGDRRPYFTMKLVQGQTLAALLRRRAGPDEDRPRFLQVFEQVCQTLAYAHACGVLHRDLKPSNVMVGAFGEVQVMDWGLAKAVGEAGQPPPTAPGSPGVDSPAPPGHTEAGTVMGTPAYMAPEQARGEVDRVDERADVFGLGAILCEILTGRPPAAGGAEEGLAAAHERLGACGADPELVRLARQCLAAEPGDRPRDAGEVARAVSAYLAGVQERLRAAEVERAAAQAREAEARAKAAAERRARRTAVGLAASLLLLAGLAGAGWYVLQQERAAATAAAGDALDEARERHSEARNGAGNLLLWSRAAAAVEKAQALADSGYCDAGLRRRVAQTLGAVRAEEAEARRKAEEAKRQAAAEAKHRQMQVRLEDLRLEGFRLADTPPPAAGPRKQGGPQGVSSAYARAYREWGLDVDALRVEEAAARIRAYPAPVAAALVTGLDYWVWGELGDYGVSWLTSLARGRLGDLLPLAGDPARPGLLAVVARCRHRLAVANRADSDPLRRQLRDAFLRLDVNRFKKLARQADAARLPTETLALVGGILANIGEGEQALALLGKASLERPEDPHFHSFLAYYGSRLGRRDYHELLRHTTAMVALRPNNMMSRQNLGIVLLSLGRHEEAVAVLSRVVATNPRAPYAHFLLGAGLEARGDRAAALEHFRTAARLQPGERRYQQRLDAALRVEKDRAAGAEAYRQGRALYEGGKPAEALARLRTSVQLRPDLEEAHALLAEALERKGDVGAAAAAYRELVGRWPNRPGARDRLLDVLGRLAEQRLKQGDRNAAAGYFAGVLMSRPNNPAALKGLGRVMLELGHPADAVGRLARYVELSPRDAEAWRLLGRAYQRYPQLAPGNAVIRTSMLNRAVAAFRKAIECGDREAETRHGLGKCLLDLRKDMGGAAAALREAAVLAPTDFELLFDFASALRRADRRAEAAAVCRRAVALRPDDAPARTLLGQVLMEHGDLDGARAALQEGLRLRGSPEGAYLLAEVCYHKGAVGEAIACVTDPIDPWAAQTAQAYAALLVLYGKAGGYRTFCAALVKHYGHTRTADEAFLMARCLALAPDSGVSPAEAVRLAELAVRADPARPWYLNALALAHVRAGQAGQAVRRSHDALKGNWLPQLNWLLLALAYQQLGKAEEARRWLDRVEKAAAEPPPTQPAEVVYYRALLREARVRVKAGAGQK
jgi:serine/threonine-protein kinase